MSQWEGMMRAEGFRVRAVVFWTAGVGSWVLWHGRCLEAIGKEVLEQITHETNIGTVIFGYGRYFKGQGPPKGPLGKAITEGEVL